MAKPKAKCVEGGRQLCKQHCHRTSWDGSEGQARRHLEKEIGACNNFICGAPRKGRFLPRLSPFREIHANTVLQSPHGTDWGHGPKLSHLPAVLGKIRDGKGPVLEAALCFNTSHSRGGWA